jgi:hypothetical protein
LRPLAFVRAAAQLGGDPDAVGGARNPAPRPLDGDDLGALRLRLDQAFRPLDPPLVGPQGDEADYGQDDEEAEPRERREDGERPRHRPSVSAGSYGFGARR